MAVPRMERKRMTTDGKAVPRMERAVLILIRGTALPSVVINYGSKRVHRKFPKIIRTVPAIAAIN